MLLIGYFLVNKDVEQTSNYSLSDSQFINKHNRYLIGETLSALTNNNTSIKEKNNLIDSVENGASFPGKLYSFSSNEINDNFYSIPEIIMINGSVNVITNSDDSAWEFRQKDLITLKFEKYESEIENQNLIIGIIQDGVLRKGESYRDLEGEYTYEVLQDGEYYIYLLNGSSDPISLKKGEIKIDWLW